MEFLKSLSELFSQTISIQPSSVEFVEAALTSTTGPCALSYYDPDQICLIRRHMISLLQDYPSFKPSMEAFIHNNGSTVNLLTANGELHVSSSVPAVPLKVLVHENYPQMAPIVYVVLNSTCPVYQNHPFVDSGSGATTCSYLENWLYPGCNLSGLVHNLVKLFSHNHPFCYSPSSGLAHPNLFSKREAMDRLVCSLYYDVMNFSSTAEKEIAELSEIQVEMAKRAEMVTSMAIEHERERISLRRVVKNMTDEADKLLNWLKVHDERRFAAVIGDDAIVDAFEGVDERSKRVIDCLAGEMAMEDSIDALDKALELGVVPFGQYIKQIVKSLFVSPINMFCSSYGKELDIDGNMAICPQFCTMIGDDVKAKHP
nr:protein ELC-like [Ipomoea batatas]